jgi:hypothetical protein
MKISSLKRFVFLLLIGMCSFSCASDLDFDQVNDIKIEPVVVANLAYFNIAAPDFIRNGQEQTVLADIPTVDFFNDKFFKERLKKAEIFIELENTIARQYRIDVVFLDVNNQAVYSTNFNVPAYTGGTNKVSRTEIFENTQLDLLKRTRRIGFRVQMFAGPALTTSSPGNLILRSSATTYLVVE